MEEENGPLGRFRGWGKEGGEVGEGSGSSLSGEGVRVGRLGGCVLSPVLFSVLKSSINTVTINKPPGKVDSPLQFPIHCHPLSCYSFPPPQEVGGVGAGISFT